MRHIVATGIMLLILPAPLWLRAQLVEKKETTTRKEVETRKESVAIKEAASDYTRDDQKLLQTSGLAADGPALLDYFRKRTFPEANAKDMAMLVAQLGADEFVIREKAYERLGVMGAGALAGIKQAETSKDPEVSRRAFQLRQRIESKAEPAIQAATARLVAITKPVGAAEVLLNFVPFAADQQVVDELCKALGAVALVDGKVEPSITQALADTAPVKRGAAGEALARAGAQSELPRVRELLKDKAPTVRLRVALALVHHKEKEALPVLIELLEQLTPEQLWPVEDILVRLAGDKAPSVSLGTTATARKTCRVAWQAWLEREGADVDLGKLQETQRQLGYTLIVHQIGNRVVGGAVRRATGEVMELDSAKNPRWKFEVPTYPVDGEIVKVDGEDRVLVAEYQGTRISERSFKGDVKWEKMVGGNPIGVQRLPSGNTFVVMQNRLIEIDRDGKEVFTLDRPNHDIFRARKLRGGDVAYVTNNGSFARIDSKTKKIIATFNVGPIPVLFGSIDVLPSGGVLVPDFQSNRVVEYSAEGRQLKSFNVQLPNSAQRLPNGHTLVTSQNTRRVVEFDEAGQEAWSYTLEVGSQPFNARRR